MDECRRARRPARRSTVRHATHAATRVRWRAPDDLGTALACFRRAICAHRRLIRLAPSFFDSAAIERDRREQEARRDWIESCNAALLKVYGPAPRPPPLVPDLPPLPRPSIQPAMELELAACRAWLRLGTDALQRFRRRHPHALVSFSRLPPLFQLATALGRLATGADSA